MASQTQAHDGLYVFAQNWLKSQTKQIEQPPPPKKKMMFWLNQDFNQATEVSRTTEVVIFLKASLDFQDKTSTEWGPY